jgi:hypothetical protein
MKASYLKQEVKNFLEREKFRGRLKTEIDAELFHDGFAVIPDFMASSECQVLREEINSLLQDFESKTQRDSVGSDCRLFGANSISKKFQKYFEHTEIRKLLRIFIDGKPVNGFTMIARMDYKEGNLGSGNGWHRDSAQYSQIKSILYLSDTTYESGPFQYLRGSHTPLAFIKGLTKGLYGSDKFRFSEQEVDRYLKFFPEQRVETFSAPAGTLILADTRGLHRGSPIMSGSRYAATNYFFFGRDIPDHLGGLLVS